MMAEHRTRRRRVRARYATLAGQEAACCDPNYAREDLASVPAESVLGLGSGSPIPHANLRSGEVVLDLGSGAGVDVFLAASRVGPHGRVVGVDMTAAMVERATEIAARERIDVEFHEALIEDLPLETASVDVVVSNCVINLSPDKLSVFREAFRVLRPGGRLVISDIVQERPLESVDQDCGCIGNAMLRAEYLEVIREAGFEDLEILDDRPVLSGRQGAAASAITLRARKR
ncbi:MAG: methyltransferase domain-containing protein [Thermoplasmata archaeon]